MNCPECQFENRDEAKFCKECGQKLELACSDCGSIYKIGSKFCDECGCSLVAESKTQAFESTSEGERKHVTVLFSDLTGYTALSERLDPEDVKEITGQIFEEVSKIITKYDGFIEKYAGDAVMVIFGVPKGHEDDPIRAIRSAVEIHEAVEIINYEIENKVGQPISMHSGINTGLVVTGEIDLERGTHGVAGDTINVAARLGQLAVAGEILVDADTFHQAEGHFNFQSLGPTKIKGKAGQVNPHKVLSSKENPITVRRLSGIRADLIGRRVEMAELAESVENLGAGKGRIFSICGEAGTGKSRLIEEFKNSLDLDQIQWIEGHAYAYSQNIPYSPLVDLLNRLLGIDERDPPTRVKERIDSGIASLVGNPTDLVPYVGGLYSLSNPLVENINPELWKSKLHSAVFAILSALAERKPTVFFLEDLHWSDPSFIELLHHAFLEIRQPAVVLCAFRPTFSLFTGHQLQGVDKFYHEIQLQDLSLSDSREMLESLLKTEHIPSDLKQLVQGKAEGNPFYLEELVNALIESETLIRENNEWILTRDFADSEIPASLHGLIAGRLDRLHEQTKLVLQEASVIGRDFLYDILKRITELDHAVDGELSRLERLNLIKTRSWQPDLEYMFKHALTQEITYGSLLKKQRRQIHEQIAKVMEIVFHDRLEEFYETLAFHYERGQSNDKAVEYLLKSGQKSLDRYSVSEAHRYFRQAFEILSQKEIKSEADKNILIDLLNSWGYSFYYLGEIKDFIDIFASHQKMVDSLKDGARAGMFYAWMGIAHYMAGKSKDSYAYLHKGLKLGRSADNQKVIGYASAWLPFACSEVGRFDEGLEHGDRALKIAGSFTSDPYLFFKPLAGNCLIYVYQGQAEKAFKGAERLLEYGEKHANSRSKVFGYFIKGICSWSVGDLSASQESQEKALEVALDPAYAQFPKAGLGLSYFLNGRLEDAENVLRSCIDFCEPRDLGLCSVMSQYTLAPVLIANGHMRQGAEMMDSAQQEMKTNDRKMLYGISENVLGHVYAHIASRPKTSLPVMVKNLPFLIKNAPSAYKNSIGHYNKAIEIFEGIGAHGFLGQSYLNLAQLHEAHKKIDKARHAIKKAIDIFEHRKADLWLEEAKSANNRL